MNFFLKIFSEHNAIKIGMSWKNDLNILQRNFPQALCFQSVCMPYLELGSCLKHLRDDIEWQSRIDQQLEEKLRAKLKKNIQKKAV